MLEIKNLKVKRGDEIILDDVSLSLAAGETVKISGANGSGKSTLLSSIFKVHGTSISSGDILVDRVSVIKLEGYELAKHGVYYAVQHPPIVGGVNTLQFLYKSYKNFHPTSTLNILGWKKNLEDKCNDYKLDINLISGELNSNLSGGEKKLAQLIHVLALDPLYLLLDELDSGVDETNRGLVYEFINIEKEKGKGILYTSHIDDKDKVNVDREYVLEKTGLVLKNKI